MGGRRLVRGGLCGIFRQWRALGFPCNSWQGQCSRKFWTAGATVTPQQQVLDDNWNESRWQCCFTELMVSKESCLQEDLEPDHGSSATGRTWHCRRGTSSLPPLWRTSQTSLPRGVIRHKELPAILGAFMPVLAVTFLIGQPNYLQNHW
jgi:hypothetical protein